jgi:hypothetical protein
LDTCGAVIIPGLQMVQPVQADAQAMVVELYVIKHEASDVHPFGTSMM